MQVCASFYPTSWTRLSCNVHFATAVQGDMCRARSLWTWSPGLWTPCARGNLARSSGQTTSSSARYAYTSILRTALSFYLNYSDAAPIGLNFLQIQLTFSLVFNHQRGLCHA